MKLVSTSYERSGRTHQKQRTREHLIAAARALLAGGGSPPTIEEAATAAAISRTTAYRYFPSQKALLAAAHPETEATSLLPRKGRAIAWFEEALAPLKPQMTDADLHLLALAIRSTTGIESLVWLTDVARLPRHQALELMQWGAQALLHHALTQGPPPADHT